MKRSALVLLITISCISGCLENEEEKQQDLQPNDDEGSQDVKEVELVNYYSWARFGTDLTARDELGMCERQVPLLGQLTGQYTMDRTHGNLVNESHYALVIQTFVDDTFAETGISGHRIGLYYDGLLVAWTESFKEPTTFRYELDGRFEQDHPRWSFAIKLTDPTTSDDSDACTAGFQSGSVEVFIHAE